MVNVVNFTKRVPPGASNRQTLAELVAKQKMLTEQQAANTGMRDIQDPMQGFAQLGQTLFTGLQERRVRADESQGREALAKLIAGVGENGATPQELAEMGMYDPELASQYRKEALAAREAEAQRAEAARLHEDTQAHDIDVMGREQTFTSGERVAGETFTAGQNTADRTQQSELQEQRIGAEADAAQLKYLRDRSEPDSPGAQVVQDYLNGNYGPVGSQEAIKRRDEEWTNVTTKGAATQIIMPGEVPDLWKEYDKKMGGNFADYVSEGAVAGSQIGALDILDQISPDSQGPLVGNLAKMFPGVSSEAALFESIVKNFAPKERVEGSGSTSDIEYAGMLKSWPDIANNPIANKAISAAIRARAQIAVDRASVIRDMRAERITMEDGYAKMDELDRRSILTPELKQIIANMSLSAGAGDGGTGGWTITGQ